MFLQIARRRLPSARLRGPVATRLRSTQPLLHTPPPPLVRVDSPREVSRAKIDIGTSAELTRNPNLSVLGLAAANDLADRRLGDPMFFGPRVPKLWYTGKAPHEVPGWVPTTSAVSRHDGHLTSLPLLSLSAACTREHVMAYFDNTWTLTEQLFASLRTCARLEP